MGSVLPLRAARRGLLLAAACSCGRLGYGEQSLQDAGARKPDALVTRAADAGELAADAGQSVSAVSSDAGQNVDAGRCPAQRELDFCEQLPALPEEPVLDGELDCGPALRELPRRGWTGARELPDSARARYAVAWRTDGLYFYVEVDDAERLPATQLDGKPWCGDGVELYADSDARFGSAPDYDDPGTMQLLAAAPPRDVSQPRAPDVRFHTRSEADLGAWSAARHGTWARDGGYVLEGFVTAADLGLPAWSLAPDARVGLDVAIDVSVPAADQMSQADCGFRAGQYFLRTASEPCTVEDCRPYKNVAAFCTPVLVQ